MQAQCRRHLTGGSCWACASVDGSSFFTSLSSRGMVGGLLPCCPHQPEPKPELLSHRRCSGSMCSLSEAAEQARCSSLTAQRQGPFHQGSSAGCRRLPTSEPEPSAGAWWRVMHTTWLWPSECARSGSPTAASQRSTLPWPACSRPCPRTSSCAWCTRSPPGWAGPASTAVPSRCAAHSSC